MAMDTVDIAFSLLAQDEPVARSIQRYLPDHVSSFLYSMKQQELIIERDGLESFPSVFREARLCVILFRARWGETAWTRLEKKTIADRFMDSDSSFLAFVRLDDAPIPSWFPRTDFWIDMAGEGAEKSARYLVGRLNALGEHGAERRTRHTYARRTIPIARYQSQFQRFMETYVPVRPETCDGCSAAVEFRPFVRVTLPATESFPAVTEQFCPRCARDRGIRVTIPLDMDEELVFAIGNPSFRSYLLRVLKMPILPVLSKDEELRTRGVKNVGAGVTSSQVSLFVDTVDGVSSLEISIPLFELQREGLRCDSELIGYFKARINAELDEV
jgi:hypothetical protein